MAERAARSRQFEYRANANLVLHQADRDRPRESEPTGEPETLWGKIGSKFGDKAQVRHRDKDLEEKLSKMKKRNAKAEAAKQAKKRKQEEFNILGASLYDEGIYRPRTKETRAVYQQILSLIQSCLEDQPQDIIRGASDEVLAILKNDNLRAPDKKKEIEGILGPLSEPRFAELTDFGKKITDFEEATEEAALREEGVDEELGVAVVFDEDEEEEEDYEIKDQDDDEEEEEEEEMEENTREILLTGQDEDQEYEQTDPLDVDPKEIKAFWLKGQVSQLVDSDPINSQNIADQILKILEESDMRECENRLVQLLDYDKFDFIKLLLKNRLKIVYCTKLDRADDSEKQAIEQEMKSDPHLSLILDQLQKSGKGRSLEQTLKKEARSLRKKDKDVQMGEKVKGKNLIDLESITFSMGSHLMSNKDCKLPPGAFRTQKKGYEEIHIPALKAPPIQEDERLIMISELPEWSQSAFPGMKSLNRVQSRIYKAAFQSSENLLLCAPTGSGKTNVAMLCVLKEIGLCMTPDGEFDLDSFKVIYIAPMKSLVQEMVSNFSKRLEPYGVQVRELTGDQNLTKQQIKETQIIVTTPEKWDIVTRKSGDRTYTQQVKLIIIDEIHLLHDDRGPVLECIVSRTIRQIETTQELIRLVGLSATLPGYDDVATFLRVKPENLFAFNNSYRPVPLEQQFVGVSMKKPLKRYELMNQITYEKMMQQVEGENQVLVFVHSRKETAKTARSLRDLCIQNDTLTKMLSEGSASREILQTESDETAKSKDLKDILPYGFGIHHAGMVRSDRSLVEDLFADGHIRVLVSTATLAWGVNLPAHTVIIKGTQVYNPEKGRWTELSPMDLMQMIGRAGRPQYDTFGEGIVLTTHNELQYYLSLINQQLPIESQLISRLPDSLNAEITLGTIQNIDDAVNWLGYSYLYVCMLRNPQLYGISFDESEEDTYLRQRRQDLAHTAATLLDKANLIKYDRKSGSFQVTDLGIVASHYYVTHSSMSIYNEYLRPTIGDIELFRIFSLSTEFKYINIREEERMELEKLLTKVPIPVKETIDEPSAKVNVLLQTYISRLKLEGFALVSDMVYITQSGVRILRALFEITLKRGWSQLAQKCLNLAKMIDRRMWGTQSPLRQFKDIPEEIVKKMERKDFPIDRLYDLNSQEIGELVNFPQVGKTLYRHVHMFPKLELTAHYQPITSSLLKIELTITPDFQFDEKYHGKAEPFWIFVEDVDEEKILHYEYFILKQKLSEEDQVLSFTVPLFEPLHPQYFIRLISDRWVGSETILPVSFKNLILPAKFLPHTELLDLQPTPISDLKNAQFQKIYEDQFQFFNPIQTQVFNTVYNTDSNTFIGAPTGSGKTICAELAILRMFSQHPQGKCVYVAPMSDILKVRLGEWQEKFGSKLGKRVVQLSGETSHDLSMLETGNIILATPDSWDLISRRWKKRKNVQNINLFIADELHLIGGENGPVFEVVVSRIRFISTQLEHKTRVVALSSPIANARDVSEWLGANSHSSFNFHPSSRPIPLEIHLQGFDMAHFGTRMMAMSRPTLYSVSNLGKGKPIIIFVPNRKIARRSTKDLISYFDPEDESRKFLKISPEILEPFIEPIKNKLLKESLRFGVGFYHEGLTEKERKIVEHLFNSGAIQVIVATQNMCWGMTTSAFLVIIMGCQYYDGREHRHVDYPTTTILQMMGRAARTVDTIGKVVIYCFGPKKEFYKKVIYDPLPIESHLDHYLHDYLNAEIVTRTIRNKQDAVDYLTWTFLYRRLTQNPNYYNLQGVSHRHLSDHLSELIENTLTDLEKSKCISIEEDIDTLPLNLGMIACFYNIKYTTIELFSASLNERTKLKGLLDILSSASEFEIIPIRQGEENILRKMASHLPLAMEKPSFTNPRTKVNILLQAHFSRHSLSPDLMEDQSFILENSIRLLQAMVDVISSHGWLNPALACMELSQMITQAVWDKDPILKQIPHLTQNIISRCIGNNLETVFDIIDMNDKDREELLQLSDREFQDVAKFCNAYPNIDLSHSVKNEEITAGSSVKVAVQLERDSDLDLVLANAPFYPKERTEGWWLVVGDTANNQLMCIKRLTVNRNTEIELEFKAPDEPGNYNFMLYFMCDSYTGCDQEYEIKLAVQENAPEQMDEEEEDNE